MLRFAALLGMGALAVHQLRYLLAGSAPGGPAHAYLGPAGSLVAGVMVLALARAVLRRAGPAPRLRVLWPATALALIAVYCVQETAEGLSPVAHGGWLAVPLAVGIALAIAVLVRGATRASVPAARPWRAPSIAHPPATLALFLPLQARPGAPRLLAARGPPSASS
jgi:peptidoglycan/LPS O-acetylase OafA/YrhL